ncbi:hypothetical protein BMS3Bbin11_00503 [bacterium BMS3Bbin11]|nr:hypothetical protein BMS3Bbin11_00503 [bacterium BMS3Bbin11]
MRQILLVFSTLFVNQHPDTGWRQVAIALQIAYWRHFQAVDTLQQCTAGFNVRFVDGRHGGVAHFAAGDHLHRRTDQGVLPG